MLAVSEQFARKENIADLASQRVVDLLRHKKASIKQARLPGGLPEGHEFSQMTWEQVEDGARANRLVSRLVRKLLTDKRFDK